MSLWEFVNTLFSKMKLLTYLENHFDSEDASKSVIEIVKDFISETTLLHRIFCGQGYAAQADDYHDEKIKVRQIDYPVSSTSNPVKSRNSTNKKGLELKTRWFYFFL